jgi:hypothetical protein
VESSRVEGFQVGDAQAEDEESEDAQTEVAESEHASAEVEEVEEADVESTEMENSPTVSLFSRTVVVEESENPLIQPSTGSEPAVYAITEPSTHIEITTGHRPHAEALVALGIIYQQGQMEPTDQPQVPPLAAQAFPAPHQSTSRAPVVPPAGSSRFLAAAVQISHLETNAANTTLRAYENSWMNPLSGDLEVEQLSPATDDPTMTSPMPAERESPEALNSLVDVQHNADISMEEGSDPQHTEMGEETRDGAEIKAQNEELHEGEDNGGSLDKAESNRTT